MHYYESAISSKSFDQCVEQAGEKVATFALLQKRSRQVHNPIALSFRILLRNPADHYLGVVVRTGKAGDSGPGYDYPGYAVFFL